MDISWLFQTPVENVALNQALNALPPGFDNVSAVFLQSMPVLPEWNSPGIKSSFYEIETTDPIVSSVLAAVREADFIAWDASFFDLMGPQARLERIQSFDKPGVHEAPAFVPETNELVYSDTSAVGWLWAINVDTHETRHIYTSPPLYNVNGARYHAGKVYLATNGGARRGIYELDMADHSVTAMVNNYRGRHLNSPNDLIFDSAGNMWFTDPPYGWAQALTDVQPPEVPSSIYFFNRTTRALRVASNNVALMPNGLALSPDEKTLYVADSNSTSGRPLQQHGDSLRNVWAFDVLEHSLLANPRLIHQTESGWPDGLQVSRGGFLFVAVYGGVDVLDAQSGVLLGRINTAGDIVFNLDRGEGVWLLTGEKYVYKVVMREV
ncbi:hypothetical protein ASPZODRAFT_105375 [Penicilliopsis zonata CBS 506.65]|uniref:SMP-30/Gluconolactonase/LRE-like region domain-containing protein n=1 Tax=Penicilliopsis zonata CBS 506.65 TaxID=1073090 RepID=A0A1L9S5B8_9EURO|nr:hypothetical protein ASPZODRAFT_105375 [Penicilliopsis zonata CBS 506.65]OJJ42327.1 hypothetical protein ASPZODRAFT_105375 [Penicilliopsis zonata CBS 506.65]